MRCGEVEGERKGDGDEDGMGRQKSRERMMGDRGRDRMTLYLSIA